MLTPQFSVLMASYGNAAYIREAIASVCAQSMSAWELIVVDDASPDDSNNIVATFDDPRIRLVRHDHNQGYVAALKTAIDEATAPVVGILDSDDQLAPEALAAMLAAFADPDVAMAYSQFVYCDADMRPRKTGYSAPLPAGSTALHHNTVSAFRTFRKAAYTDTQGLVVDLDYAEDKDLIYKLEEVGKLAFVDEPLYLYRVLTDSQAHGPRRRIGLQRFAEARWRAYNRRLGSSTPNLDVEQMANTMFGAGWIACKGGEWAQARAHFRRAFALRCFTGGYVLALLLQMDHIGKTWPRPVAKER